MASGASILKDFFTEETYDSVTQNRIAKCTLCDFKIKGKGTTTSNYRRHVEKIHPKQ